MNPISKTSPYCYGIIGKKIADKSISEIVKLANENEQFKMEVNNLFFVTFYEIQKRGQESEKGWNYGITPLHKKYSFNYIVEQIRELLKENKELKKSKVTVEEYESLKKRDMGDIRSLLDENDKLKEENEKLKQSQNPKQGEDKINFKIIKDLFII